MPTVTGEIVIDCPVEEVFDLVSDERNEPRYNPAMVRVEKATQGPVGRGTRFRAVHAGWRPVDLVVELTDYDRPTRLGSITTMSWGEVRGALVLRRAGEGTRMSWTWDLRPRGAARLAGPLIALIGRRAERACWLGLKRYLEGTADVR